MCMPLFPKVSKSDSDLWRYKPIKKLMSNIKYHVYKKRTMYSVHGLHTLGEHKQCSEYDFSDYQGYNANISIWKDIILLNLSNDFFTNNIIYY